MYQVQYKYNACPGISDTPCHILYIYLKRFLLCDLFLSSTGYHTNHHIYCFLILLHMSGGAVCALAQRGQRALPRPRLTLPRRSSLHYLTSCSIIFFIMPVSITASSDSSCCATPVCSGKSTEFRYDTTQRFPTIRINSATTSQDYKNIEMCGCCCCA